MLLAAYRYGGYGFYHIDPTYILVIIGLLLSLWASSVVNSTFNKYSKVRCMSNLSGAEAARKVVAAQMAKKNVLMQKLAKEPRPSVA